jgi:ribosomal protein S18 acetylase RimI-like enzyme
LNRAEQEGAFLIREATAGDIPALARLHAQTFRETHGGGPSCEVREEQYRHKFAATGGSWFCFVVARPDGGLAGFAIGEPYAGDGYDGRLNKLYLLRRYHRLGLGRMLVGHVVRRFLDRGVASMLLFSEADNPSIGFFEALGGARLLSETGEFHGGYGWQDLTALAARCPIA